MRDGHQRLGRGGVRVDPGAFDIGLEDARLTQNAMARMNAALGVEQESEAFAGDRFDPIASILRDGRPALWRRPGSCRSTPRGAG